MLHISNVLLFSLSTWTICLVIKTWPCSLKVYPPLVLPVSTSSLYCACVCNGRCFCAPIERRLMCQQHLRGSGKHFEVFLSWPYSARGAPAPPHPPHPPSLKAPFRVHCVQAGGGVLAPRLLHRVERLDWRRSRKNGSLFLKKNLR